MKRPEEVDLLFGSYQKVPFTKFESQAYLGELPTWGGKIRMETQIFVNLPVKDLARSNTFFKQLGFGLDPKFSDERASCLILGENTYAMLLVESFFQTFTKKTICDATKSTEVLVCLSCESRAKVDELVKQAIAAGGRVPREPQDHGFMYGHGFEDLDGHIWELMFMEPAS